MFFAFIAYLLFLVTPTEELAVLYVGVAFNAFPMMVIVGFSIKLIEDLRTVSKLKIEKSPLSLGQKAFLVNRRTATEYLMEFTFYESLFNQQLNLIITSYETTYREIVNFEVQSGPINGQYTPDRKVFVEALTSDKQKLSEYLKRVYQSSGRFKAYRKDVLIKSLVTSGYINKWGWAFNLFILTQEGKEMKNKISKYIKQQNQLLDLGLSKPEQLEKVLPRLNKYCLLSHKFEVKLTELHNMVVDVGLITLALKQSIGILFDYRLSLRTFNAYLKAAYFYRLPWSWHDNDSNRGLD